MTGNLILGSNKAQSTAVPTLAQDLCNKTYVDSAVSTATGGSLTQTTADTRYLKLDGTSVPTADISMNSRKITNLAAPTTGNDAVNKTYTDT